MEDLRKLGIKMEQQMKATLTLNPKDGFWYDNDDLDVYYTEEGIRLAVYEDIKDSLNCLYSECAY
jgi:hypothetical protein